MSESKIDKAISGAAYILDCLATLKSIQECGCCNDCAKRKYCQYVPALGQTVRYNCIFYEGKKQDELF